MNTDQKGFTLVEVMIVVTIIALLGAIAIPSLIKAKTASNDTMARATLKSISQAVELYASANNQNYPLDITALTGATPAFLNVNYCAATISGYTFACSFAAGGYTFTATPLNVGVSGSTTYTITTGGLLTP